MTNLSDGYQKGGVVERIVDETEGDTICIVIYRQGNDGDATGCEGSGNIESIVENSDSCVYGES